MPYKDPEAARAKARERYHQNPAQAKANNRRWRAANPHKKLQYEVESYGISVADYETLLAKQGGKCAICLSPDPKGKGRWHIDHCHNTGIVRGLLCQPCNTALGLFKDDKTALQRAVDYLGNL